ncbi:prolyl oligopeptidase family serine peptidase [soil metagenome]
MIDGPPPATKMELRSLTGSPFAADGSLKRYSESSPGTQTSQFLNVTYSNHVWMDYLLYLPASYDADQKKEWPLILFLHGSGERGYDLAKIKTHGLPPYLDTQKDFPFIVVSPQCPEHQYYDNDQLIVLLNEIQRKYRVDSSRVYLTGLSMGGWGAWQLACAHPERFAAVAPVSGWGLEDLAENMKDLPVWAFHGADDKAVPLDWDQRMINEVKKAGGDPKFTIYPGMGHNIWKKTYENPELYEWFLAHQNTKHNP